MRKYERELEHTSAQDFYLSNSLFSGEKMGKEINSPEDDLLKKKGVDAILGIGWENIRGNIPKGKFRVALIDMFGHTATVIEDFNSEKEAREYVADYAEELDEWESFVIYDDQGHLLYDTDWDKEEEENEVIKFDLGGEEVEIQFPNNENENYAVVIFFLDEKGNFEDLLFEVFEDINDAKRYAKEAREKYKDAWKVMVVDREGKEVRK